MQAHPPTILIVDDSGSCRAALPLHMAANPDAEWRRQLFALCVINVAGQFLKLARDARGKDDEAYTQVLRDSISMLETARRLRDLLPEAPTELGVGRRKGSRPASSPPPPPSLAPAPALAAPPAAAAAPSAAAARPSVRATGLLCPGSERGAQGGSRQRAGSGRASVRSVGRRLRAQRPGGR